MSITGWTDDEDVALIRQWRFPPDWHVLREALPGRSDAAIWRRASRLGVTRPKASASTRWTEEEGALVTTRYAELGQDLLGHLPGRSPKSLREMASTLGVSRRR